MNIFLSIGLKINFVLGAQKKGLNETVLLSIHNIRFGRGLNIRLGMLIRTVSLRRLTCILQTLYGQNQTVSLVV